MYHSVKPSDWRSICELRRDYVIANDIIKEKLEQLRQSLIGDLIAQGYGEANAGEIVAQFLIGERRVKESATRKSSLAASPEASRLLCLPERLVLPKDWKTADDLVQERTIARTTLYRRINTLRDSLISDMTAIGIEHELAGHLVEINFIGIRVSATGWPALAFSPEGLIMAEAVGLFERKGRGRPPILRTR